MTNVASVLQQVRSLGVDIRPVGGKLQLRPPGKLPAELLAAVIEHKTEIIAFLAESDAESRGALSRALEQKHQEIAVMRKRLGSPHYAGDIPYQQWGKDVIACLQSHINETQRYLKEGGTLRLPPCCQEDGSICLIAMRRFNGCLVDPDECGFSMRPGSPAQVG